MSEYALFLGCTISYKVPHLEAALRFVLEKLAVRTEDLPFGCCPEPNGIRGCSSDVWYALAARNLAVAEERNLDMITCCNGCYETLNYANVQFEADATLLKRINGFLENVGKRYGGTVKVLHFPQFLHDKVGFDRIRERVVSPLSGLKVAVHYGCHSLRPKSMNPPEDPENPRWLWELVEAVLGAHAVHYLDETQCCGAGIFELSQADSLKLAGRKIRQMEQMEANAILVPCPTCYLQFDAGQQLIRRKDRSGIRGTAVFYLAELLAVAMGAAPDALGMRYHLTRVDPGLLTTGVK